MIDLSWPHNGSDFNLWYLRADLFTALLRKHEGFWIYNYQLKYLNLRIDTRNGNFVLYADQERISPDLVLDAIQAQYDSYHSRRRTPA